MRYRVGNAYQHQSLFSFYSLENYQVADTQVYYPQMLKHIRLTHKAFPVTVTLFPVSSLHNNPVMQHHVVARM